MTQLPTTMTETATSTETLTNPIINENIESTRQFDLKLARDAFVNCVQTDGQLLLCEYVRAYEELCV
jgi:hypothetical protein